MAVTSGDQAEKELPQEQALLAFGLVNLKPEPSRLSTKSMVAPEIIGRLAGSMKTLTSPYSITVSSGAAVGSSLRPYWKPDQPPPLIWMRKPWAAPSEPLMNRLTALMALSVRVTMCFLLYRGGMALSL